MASPSCTGQQALQPLPSKDVLAACSKPEAYPLPNLLLQERSSLKSKLELGLPVLKVSKNGKLQPRRLAFSKDRRNILITTSKIRSVKGLFKAATGREASAKVIPLLSVDRIQRGSNSGRFVSSQSLHAPSSSDDAEETKKTISDRLTDWDKSVSLSIVFRNTDSSCEMLDLVVPSKKDYEMLMNSLEHLVSLAQTDIQRYTTDIQLLHHCWAEMNKEWDAPMTMSEWMQLADKLYCPLKNPVLMALFQDKCKGLSKEDEVLSLPDIGLLVDEVRRQSVPAKENHILKLWNDLVKSDPKPAVGLYKDKEDDDAESLEMSVLKNDEDCISAVAFLSFLRSHQKEYSTTLEEAVELIQNLNLQKTAQEWENREQGPIDREDRLCRSRFISFLSSDANDLMRPDMGRVVADDMSHPLSSYWIHTSHDTYLKELPDSYHGKSAFAKLKADHLSVNSQAYTAALLRGVRCLELDLWNGLRGQPVVARQKPALNADLTSTPLVVVLRTVRYFLEQNPESFPIILNIENHCSSDLQSKVAQDIYDVLGAADLIAAPKEGEELDDDVILPSPESARGKVIIMGKRPKRASSIVINDHFDCDNDKWVPTTTSPSTLKSKDQYDEGGHGTVVGFNPHGPIRKADARAIPLSPDDLLKDASEQAQNAQRELDEVQLREAELHRQADEQETLAAQLTLKAGLTPNEVKVRAARAAGGTTVVDDDGEEVNLQSEEKSEKEEGVEVHEVLPDFVEGGRDRYAHAAQEALEASHRFSSCEAKLKSAEREYQRAVNNLNVSYRTEKEAAENAKRAAAEARAQSEHATTAHERVEKVRELLRNSHDRSTSAGTVVQTALTEAKISEKRALDAEARAKRAQGVAEKDRFRADEETKIEESMEQEVSDLHEECVRAGEAVKNARIRADKAAAMLDRATEQIRIIENSSQYRQEMFDLQKQNEQLPKPEGSFIFKHAVKVEEAKRCRELIKEATEETAHAEGRRARLQAHFEEKAHAWRIQSEVASQKRRLADRSSVVAEELTEHAEEEREAALLRLTARQRAEAAVESRVSQKESSEAQFAEAERAAAEAAKMAVQSRSRADRLAREAELAKDHSQATQLVEERKWEVEQAQAEFEAAQLEKQNKDTIVVFEKRRLDTAAELCKTATRDAAVDTNRVRVVHLFEQEAIVAFNTALLLRKEANKSSRRTDIKKADVETKSAILKHAQVYKEVIDMAVEIPSTLANLTLLHSTKFKHWEISKELSNTHVHSFAQNALLDMMRSSPEEVRKGFQSFTKNHLCRVFPAWREILAKNTTNYDPVLAWSLGCQLVAMNLQSADENLLAADGLFRKNGSCGYVLKPSSLTHDSTPVASQTWLIKVLSGSNLVSRSGRRTVNPFVTISEYGGSEALARNIFMTDTVKNNGLNPVWDENKAFCLSIEKPEISLISFAVWNKVDEKTDEFIGGAAMPVSCLRQGYRSIPLFNPDNSRDGRQAYSSLVVKASLR